MGKIAGGTPNVRPATRAILRALALLGSARGLELLCSLLRTKLVAIWVGQAGVAMLGIFTAATEMISALAQQGLRTSSVGSIANAKASGRLHHVASLTASYGLIIGLAGAALTLILSPLLSTISFGQGSGRWIFAPLAAAVLFNAIVASRQAIAQGTGALARLARASLTGSVAGFILSIPLTYFLREAGMVWIVVAYSLSTALAFIFPRLRIDGSPLSRLPFRQTIREGSHILRLGIWLTLSSAIDWGVSYAFMSWLRGAAGEDIVGLYQSGYTIAIRYMGILFSTIALEFFPRLAVGGNKSSWRPRILIAHETAVVLRLAVPAAALMILLAPWIIRILYSSAFVDAAPFLAGALAATPLRALSWCAAFLIIARGDGKTYLLAESVSGAVSLTLFITLYTIGSLAGLGIAYILWYGIYTATILIILRLRYKVVLPPSTLIATLATTLILALLAALPLHAN